MGFWGTPLKRGDPHGSQDSLEDVGSLLGEVSDTGLVLFDGN